MQLEFTNIPITLDAMLPQNGDMLRREVAKACGLAAHDLKDMKLLRRSVDARKKSNVHFVVNVAVDIPSVTCASDIKHLHHMRKGVVAKPYEAPAPLVAPDCHACAANPDFKRPVVVGAGPAGLFAALYLALAGLRPLIVERGKPVEERLRDIDVFASGGALDPNSNVQFGEGGAGTFSDGKLNTGTKSPHIRHVLEAFVEAGAPADILVDARPHIGTDLLPGVVRQLRTRIEALGGTFCFQTQLVDVQVAERALTAVTLRNLCTNETYTLSADALVLATGHSARDTFAMMEERDIPMERKPFAVGVRIEHCQADINHAQYGAAAHHPALGAADYKLATHNADGRGVYTFCMCPGGTVVAASSEEGALCVNGMSTHARDGLNANSALLVEVRPDDVPGSNVLAGIAMQRDMERAAYEAGRAGGGAPYTAPAQTVGDFMTGASGTPSTTVTPSYPRGVAWCDLHDCLPSFVAAAIKEGLPHLGQKLKGFDDANAVMTGVEPRSSSPVRIVRDRQTLQSVGIEGFYPAGEGAGYAGGIMSAAVDGLRVAEAVCERIRETCQSGRKGGCATCG